MPLTLPGYKTYLIAALMIGYAVASVYFGQMDVNTAIQFVLNGLGLGALRAGVSKV